MTTRQLLVRGSWVPPALWAATLFYLRRYDGWGGWAAAPLLLPAILLGGIWVAAGLLFLGRRAVGKEALDWGVLAATLVGGAPLLYYLVRHVLRGAG